MFVDCLFDNQLALLQLIGVRILFGGWKEGGRKNHVRLEGGRKEPCQVGRRKERTMSGWREEGKFHDMLEVGGRREPCQVGRRKESSTTCWK